MKCACQDEVIVYIEFVESGIKVALEDETTGFIDYDEGINDPGKT